MKNRSNPRIHSETSSVPGMMPLHAEVSSVLEDDALAIGPEIAEAMRVGGVGPGIRRHVRRGLHVGQRAVEEIEVQTTVFGLAPTHAVLVGELQVLSCLPHLELPAGLDRVAQWPRSDVGTQQVLHVAVRPGEAEADVGDVHLRREPQVLAQSPVRHVVAAGDEGAAEVVGHPVGLDGGRGQRGRARASSSRPVGWLVCVYTHWSIRGSR